MLEELRIRNLGVIDDVVLPLGPGLTVVSGETGAGKTMVVTALLLLFGARADAARIRVGTDHAIVDGRIRLDENNRFLEESNRVAARVADAGGALDEDGGLILRRTVGSTGRSRAYVGGAPVPVGVLGELAEHLVAVHGQADQMRLTRPAEQRAAVDRYAGLDAGPYASAYGRWRVAADALEDRTRRARELRQEFDLLSYGLDEIASADPQPSEDERLTALARRLADADGLRQAAQMAHDLLVGDPDDLTSDTDVRTLLGRARRSLDAQAGSDPQLDAAAAALDELIAATGDLGADLSGYADGLETDPERLAEIEERRAVLRALTRKYGDDPTGRGTIDGVLAWAATARDRIAALDVSAEALQALQALRDAAADEAAGWAGELSVVRTKAAGELGQQVTAELAAVAMADAAVEVTVRRRTASAGAATLSIDGEEVAAGPDGVDEVELRLRPHPDATWLPLARGVSGGELSRVMLAVEVCLAASDPVPTMVFDEVDAGVGGRVAVQVGRRLARLARDRQVVVVTHLAQVAAYGDRHVTVRKSAAGGVTRSDVRTVDGAERITELARMLAGSDSATAKNHAAELLDRAERDRGR